MPQIVYPIQKPESKSKIGQWLNDMLYTPNIPFMPDTIDPTIGSILPQTKTIGKMVDELSGIKETTKALAPIETPVIKPSDLLNIYRPTKESFGGFVSKPPLQIQPPISVPLEIKDEYANKVVEAIQKNSFEKLTPFVEAIKKDYGISATQDLANPQYILTKAFKKMGLTKGFGLMLKTYAPQYEQYIMPLIYSADKLIK